MEVYGEPVTCDDCGSDNVVERERWMNVGGGGAATYLVAVCLRCGWERGL